MRKGLAKKILDLIRDFTLFFLALGCVLLFSRCYEWILLALQHGTNIFSLSYLTSGLLIDLRISFLTAIPLWIIYRGMEETLSVANPALKSISWIITLVGIGNLLLITYFSATLVPLGPEFWAYSWVEMTNTIIASEWLSLLGFLLLLTLAVVVHWISRTTIKQSQEYLTRKVSITLCAGGFLAIVTGWLPGVIEDTTSKQQDNKLAYFISSSIRANNFYSDSQPRPDKTREYPFLHRTSEKDVLGPFFKDTSTPPNIVFLIVESLGGEFVGKSGRWNGFAPYLDSLAQESLYWPNGLSLSGRTFGVAPSLLGSLPPGRHGFMDLGPNYPHHQTLISLLNKQGYHTAFYSAYDTYFDNLDYFLEYQQTDFILNKQLIEKRYSRKISKDAQNYWGFADKTMFDIVSGILDTTAANPRLEVYHTLQSHSPFTVPNPEKYDQKFNSRLRSIKASDTRKKSYKQYQEELTTLLYTDEAIRTFMNNYKKRAEFKNTIFVITGDHWLIPVPQTSQISRYHVPIIMYSPLLKQSAHFKSVNTHANITPSITSFLEQNHDITIPDSVHWIGSVMDTSRSFHNMHSIPLMKNKNQLTDYIHKNYYLSSDQLFRLQDGLRLQSISASEKKTELQKSFNHFKMNNQYVVTNDKLYPGSMASEKPQKYNFIARYDTLFQRIDSLSLSADQQFHLARQHAFDDQYDTSRAIARRLLMRYPDYHDVRLLLGRTYAWEGQYDEARTIFNNVLKRDSTYYDTYNALSDTERWAGNPEAALKIINKGLEYHPDQEQFLEKKIRILAGLSRNAEAAKVYEHMQSKYPGSEKLQTLRQYILN